MAGVKGIFQGFRFTPRQGGGRRSPAECSRRNIRFPGETPPRQGIRQAVSSGRKFPPAGKPPGQDRRKSPLKKYGRREKSSHRWPAPGPFPFAAGTCPGREECAEQMSAGKRLPQEKSLLRNMPLRRRPQRKNLHRPLTSCRSAQNARQRRKEQRNTGGGNLALPGEQKNFQRLAHGSGKKLAMEKEVNQMHRITHDTGKKKRPARVTWPE